MVLFRVIIFVSLTFSVCGVLLSQKNAMEGGGSGSGADSSGSIFERFRHVLVDVDGTINSFHPEQNPGDKKRGAYYPKDGKECPEHAVVDQMGAFAGNMDPADKTNIAHAKLASHWCPLVGEEQICAPPLEHYTANYHFGERLYAGNKDFVEKQLLPLNSHGAGRMAYFVALASDGWTLDEYQNSLDKLEMRDANTRLISATEAPGKGYVAKANAIRLLAGCAAAEATKYKSGVDERNEATNNYSPKGDVVSKSRCDLSDVLVIDDCPFTMSAYRVHLSFMLPGLKTLFVAPHFSIINDAEAMSFLTQSYVNFDEPRYRRANPYKQYSTDKPAQGIDVTGAAKCNPRIGQSVYYVNGYANGYADEAPAPPAAGSAAGAAAGAAATGSW